jgi:hypothetical protein
MVRRLEREYGEVVVHEKYNEILAARFAKARRRRKSAEI